MRCPCRWGASLADKPHGYSLLHLAAGVGSLSSVTFLLECGADPNGEQPPACGMLQGCLPCVVPPAPLPDSLTSRSCLAAAHPPAAEHGNVEGATPLHSAALGGCPRCTGALLQAGGNPGLTDAEGKLPADLAAPEVRCRLPAWPAGASFSCPARVPLAEMLASR